MKTAGDRVNGNTGNMKTAGDRVNGNKGNIKTAGDKVNGNTGNIKTAGDKVNGQTTRFLDGRVREHIGYIKNLHTNQPTTPNKTKNNSKFYNRF